jgi:hypothetical protein
LRYLSVSNMAPLLVGSHGNIPVFQIDLSLPPRERYKALALAYKSQISTITPLFNELLADLGIPGTAHGTINTLARLMLRGLHSQIETAELRGISDVTGVDMYLLVALNVVLDLLMGCTSSAVRSSTGNFWHLRTLDWGMDPLRHIIVQLDFIRSGRNTGRGTQTRASSAPEVIASSITYVGFVGVLTGVRPGLSMSLNFRAVHDAVSRWGHFKFYAHHIAVLLGYRESISSILRRLLLDNDVTESSQGLTHSLDSIPAALSNMHTTAAYLVFSDGVRAVALEKDYCTAKARWASSGFLVATNHDFDVPNTNKDATPAQIGRKQVMSDILEESEDRAKCIDRKWKKRVRSTKAGKQVGISLKEAIVWVSDYPTTNETTHFATVMDPSEGKIKWAHAYVKPAGEARTDGAW